MKAAVIRAALADDQFLCLCLSKLYEAQTMDEQKVRTTMRKNRVGFSIADGRACSEAAEAYLRDGYLPSLVLEDMRVRLQKYAHQLELNHPELEL